MRSLLIAVLLIMEFGQNRSSFGGLSTAMTADDGWWTFLPSLTRPESAALFPDLPDHAQPFLFISALH